jgi:SecD/SecF fusion protein
VKRPLLLLALVLGLVAASAVAIALKPAVLGLDLQGGVEVVLQGQPTDESEVTPEAIERSVEIIRSRVDSFGVAEPEIQTQGNDQIVVALPGADNPGQVVSDLIQPAQLVFINFNQNVVPPPEGQPEILDAIRTAQKTAPDNDRGLPSFYALDTKTKQLIAGPEKTRQALDDSLPRGMDLADVQVERVPRGLFLAYQEAPELQTRADSAKVRTWFVFQNNPGLTGNDVTEARSTIDTGVGGNEPIVTMQFTDQGRQKFADITRQLALDGKIQGQLQSFAIILDGQIVSNPTIDYNIYPGGIDGRNGAQIQGNFSRGEADTLAKQINSGALPITLDVISEKQVSATLGKESLRQGLIAGAIGLLLVMLFLVFYYRFLGLIAAMALVVYGVLLYGVMVLVPVTLTLPGIAGIILTIGVASDANVVIFERVREEARSGKPPRAAILAGYKKGITAIIDANVVTVATAAILFLFATAGIKGFAFTLLIGTLLSLFTAVVATRAVFNVLAETRFLRDDRVMALSQREIQWKMDFVGRWKLWMAISFIPLVVGAGWIGIKGLNLGLDFESGTRITSSFERQPSEDTMRALFRDAGFDDAKIQSTTEVIDGQEVRGFQIQTHALDTAERQAVRNSLDDAFGVIDESFQSETVGPTFGAQIIRNAIWAILLSFLVIVIYLTIRFEYKLALPALLSVVHDVWLAIAIYSFTGREVTSATVAALLTILGYSLYDVVIVFDRIRENVPLMRRATYRQVVNTSIHETLNRSIITSLTTLIPLVVLFFFGGDTLKDFAFALIVGILAGGISSIAIAGPLAALWKEREPESRKRATKAQRRALRVAGDADVVDLDVLERAEAGLEADIALEEGEPEPHALSERSGAADAPEDDATGEPVGDDTGAPLDENADTSPSEGGADTGDGADAAPDDGAEQAPKPRRKRTETEVRPRRHQQVQRRKRR